MMIFDDFCLIVSLLSFLNGFKNALGKFSLSDNKNMFIELTGLLKPCLEYYLYPCVKLEGAL